MVPLLTYHRVNSTAENEKNPWTENIPGKIAENFHEESHNRKDSHQRQGQQLKRKFYQSKHTLCTPFPCIVGHCFSKRKDAALRVGI